MTPIASQTRSLAALILGLILALGAPLAAWAQGELVKVDSSLPVEVRAQKVTYDEPTESYLAEGEVEIIQGDLRLMADKARLYEKTMVAEAEGRARLETPEQTLTAETMVVDMDGDTGKVYDGRLFIKSNNFYVWGKEISKTGKETYHLTDGGFTSCEGDRPAWQFSAKQMEVDYEGYGTAQNATFEVKDLPLLYTPWLMFPAKFQRQSGFLPPKLGSSDRDGFVASIPYYQTLGEDQDATLTLNYMSQRGLDTGLEYRYHLAPGSKGMIMADYMSQDSQGEELFHEGKNAQPYDSRWWVRAKADQMLFNDRVRLWADIDLVSDQDYLREFTFGHSGYEESNQRFIRWLGRDLNPNTSLVRENQINMRRAWSSTLFNAGMLYYDDTSSDNKYTMQSLPQLTFGATRQAVGNTGFYFQMDSSYHYYYREKGSTGSVADISPVLSLPMNVDDYWEVEPRITWNQRFYAVNLNEGEDPSHQESGSSEQYTLAFNNSTYLFRIFDLGSAADPLKIKHALRPFINYNYKPSYNENDIAELARRTNTRNNYVSYGFNNTFTSKVIGTDQDTGEVMAIYREFLRLSISQSYDIIEATADKTAVHPFGNFDMSMEFDPSDNIYAQSNASFNPYADRLEIFNTQLLWETFRGDRISTDYRYTYDDVNQIAGTLKVALTSDWFASYIRRYDLQDERDFETTYELSYEGQCWGIRAFYTDSIREQGYYLAFSLGGFGEIFGYGRSQR